jgi:hypothetical protein
MGIFSNNRQLSAKEARANGMFWEEIWINQRNVEKILYEVSGCERTVF